MNTAVYFFTALACSIAFWIGVACGFLSLTGVIPLEVGVYTSFTAVVVAMLATLAWLIHIWRDGAGGD